MRLRQSGRVPCLQQQHPAGDPRRFGPVVVRNAAVDAGPGPAPTPIAPSAPSAASAAPVPSSTWKTRYLAALAAVDVVASTVGATLAYLVRFGFPHHGDGAQFSAVAAVLLPLMWVAAVALSRAYDRHLVGAGSAEFDRVFRAFLQLTVVIALLSYATHASIARGYVLLALPLTLVLDLVGRYGVRRALLRQRRRDRAVHRVLAVGDAAAVSSFATVVARDRHAGMRVHGACITRAIEFADRDELARAGAPVLGDVGDVLSAALAIGADVVAVLPGGEIDGERLRWISWQLEGTPVDVVVAPGIVEVDRHRLHIRPVAGVPLLHVEQPTFRGFRMFCKDVFDRTVAALALLVLLPVLLALGLVVRLTSPGPALFRQVRVGRDGRTFSMLKFRSMTVDAESWLPDLASLNDSDGGVVFKMIDDPRTTRVGRVLRRYSLDELPQLVNVLAGHMSLVGPRPPLPVEVLRYASDERRRLLLRPGLTGLWQVSGRSDLTWAESVRLDLRYVENWSPALDLMILCKTASAVIRRTGAY